MAQNDKNFCLTPYMRTCTSYDCGFWCTCVRSWYLEHFFFFSFFQNLDFSSFSKFVNKCQKEILRCAPPSSHVCFFYVCTKISDWKFCYFTNWSLFGFLIYSGGYWKKPVTKIGYFTLRKREIHKILSNQE